MIFSLLITSPPSSQASHSAYQFARALLSQKHTQKHSLYRVFFYHDGAYHGSSIQCVGQDEFDLSEAWEALQKEYSFDIVVCIAAGLKRGVINATEAARYDKQQHNLSDHIELSGLGQLADAAASSERLITFGGANG
jgi:tRNA 2-thiouridine synthesizing protein D